MRAMLATTVFVLSALCAAPLPAQTPDGRWSPWLGCWELVTPDARPKAGGEPAPADAPPRMCVTPAPGGARVETTVQGQSPIVYAIVPDGTDRPVEEADCRGTQRTEWSRDGLRLFGAARLTCAADRMPRQVSNLALLAPNGQWVDVQTVTVNGRESLRVRRYRRASTGAASVAASTAARLDVDDVREAATKVSPLALEATLVEANNGFNLKSKTLRDLAEAGVTDRVIDLMIALSYPDRFVVEPTSRAAMSVSAISRPPAVGWAYGYANWYDDFAYWPYYDPGFVVAGPPIFIGDGGGIGGGTPPSVQPLGPARAVDGQGYTRVRPREPEPESGRRDRGAAPPSTLSTASASSATSTSSSSSSAGSSDSSSSSGSSGGSSASPSGFTSGGSGDTGRTAVPR